MLYYLTLLQFYLKDSFRAKEIHSHGHFTNNMHEKAVFQALIISRALPTVEMLNYPSLRVAKRHDNLNYHSSLIIYEGIQMSFFPSPFSLLTFHFIFSSPLAPRPSPLASNPTS